MEGYYRTMIENLPEEADYFVQEYKDNTLSVEEMRQVYEQQQEEWGPHTVRDINLIKDENSGLYYAHIGSLSHQGLLYEHLMVEQLYAQKENVDWQRVTDGYDYREVEWLRDILTRPLVWIPVEEVENECVVVGKVAREEPRPDAINDREIYNFCWELEKKGLLWFADTMPVLRDVRQVGRMEYDRLPEDMILWDRLMCGDLFKSYPREIHRSLEYIAEHRGAAKAVEIVERFREDWQDIITLRLFNSWKAEDYEVQSLHRVMFEEMDRQLRIWKSKVEASKVEEPKSAKKKPAQQDRTYITFTMSGITVGHIDMLRHKLIQVGWIAKDTLPDDFYKLFSGKTNSTKITWTGAVGKGMLLFLFQKMVDQGEIVVPENHSITTILESHFVDEHGTYISGLNSSKESSRHFPIIKECLDILQLEVDND